MGESITITNDQIVTVPLSFSDSIGTLPAPSSGGSLSIDHPEFISAYLTSDDQYVIVTPISDGVAIITYTNTDGVSDTLTVTVIDPTPTSVAFVTGSAVIGPKMNTWKPDFSTEFDLSNGNKTATTNVINHTSTIVGTFSRIDEKVYFEMISGPSNAGLYYGLAEMSVANNELIGATIASLGLRNDGHWFHANSDSDSGIGNVDNLHLAFAVDLGTREIYVRDNANPSAWFGDGAGADPVAGTGGFAFGAAGEAMLTAFTSNQNGVNHAVTVLSRAADFSVAPPSGYVAWA